MKEIGPGGVLIQGGGGGPNRNYVNFILKDKMHWTKTDKDQLISCSISLL